MIRTAVIGRGYWGTNVTRVFDTVDGSDLRVVCDPDPSRLTKVRGSSADFRTSTDTAATLNADDVDAVAICTPVGTHFELAKQALEAGKHVWVEKPLTDSAEQAQALVALAAKHERVLFVDHTFLYSGAVKKIRSLLDSGEIGDLLYFDGVRINLGLFQSDVNVIWDLAPHDVSILLHLIDSPPKWVAAIAATHYGEHESQAYLTIGFEGSALAHVHVNWLAPVKLRSTVIGGSKRMVVYDDLEPSEKVKIYEKGVTFSDSDDQRARTLVDYRTGDMHAPHIDKNEPLQEAAADFLGAIENGSKPISDGETGVAVVRILEAAAWSCRNEGVRVSLEETS